MGDTDEMSKSDLLALNIFFFVFHTALVLFNVFGWIPRRTRRANLYCLLATAASWLVMGMWHGIGYCILTDWHWQVRHALGFHDTDQSYIQLLVRELTGWSPSDALAKNVAGITFAYCLVIRIVLNVKDARLSLAAKGQNPDFTSTG